MTVQQHQRTLREINTKVIAEQLPPMRATESLLIEGGHFTIQRFLINEPELLTKASGSSESMILSVYLSEPPIKNNEIIRGNDNNYYYLVQDGVGDIGEDEELIKDRWELQFPISDTMISTFKFALDLVRQSRDTGVNADLGTFVGDFALPPVLRDTGIWLLPSVYRDLLSEEEQENCLQLISEAKCRNQGKRRILDKKRSILESRDGQESEYDKYGYAIINIEETNNLYLTSDVILEHLNSKPYATALTKQGKNPTCALILAGKLYLMDKNGYTSFVSLYDRNDDKEIRRKNIEGMFIVSHLVPEFNLRSVFFTTVLGGRTRKLTVDRFDPEDIRQPGPDTLEHLIEETLESNELWDIHVFDALCTETCSIAKTRIHK